MDDVQTRLKIKFLTITQIVQFCDGVSRQSRCVASPYPPSRGHIVHRESQHDRILPVPYTGVRQMMRR